MAHNVVTADAERSVYAVVAPLSGNQDVLDKSGGAGKLLSHTDAGAHNAPGVDSAAASGRRRSMSSSIFSGIAPSLSLTLAHIPDLHQSGTFFESC